MGKEVVTAYYTHVLVTAIQDEAPWCKTLGGVPHGYKFVRMIIVRHVL